LTPRVATASPSEVAVGIGGLLLGYGGLSQFVVGLVGMVDAAIAWAQIRPIVNASARTDSPIARALVGVPRADSSDRPVHVEVETVLQARNITFTHPGRVTRTIQDCELVIHRGERILLEGSSGSGKTTLLHVLAGLEAPMSGLLLLNGFDRASLGAGPWRKRVVVVPQFHDNHVLADTLLFNVLMGRGWPPAPGDIKDADRICRELGLGPLIDRMPSRMRQTVGDTGWQLSHGERSRVFVARALLQRPDVVMFDESFAALDPNTLAQCLECILARSPALILVAHP
jgi:ATP-binding cassette subfamily B protein